MTDRELLELAAKAAGINIFDWTPGGHPTTDGSYDGIWNPLTDDGDALRLATELDLNVFHAAGACYAMPSDGEGDGEVSVSYRDAGGKNNATRRAITRAAAEIGRSMP